MLTKTGPNGVESCYQYDPLGRQITETDRCNSPTPLVTTMQYFVVPETICVDPPCPASTFALPQSKVMTITTPPTGASTWSYANDQGNSVGTLAYAFDGGFIETTTAYNALGQVTQVAKPFYLSSLEAGGTPAYSRTFYDDYHRVQTVTDDLGVIDDSGTAKSTTATTTYSGSTSETDRVVHAESGGVVTSQTEARRETKNALGKVAAVSTSMPDGTMATISYSYDADGNVTVTSDPSSNLITMTYDPRGRKISMTDPDMGTWSYVQDGFGDLVSQTACNGGS